MKSIIRIAIIFLLLFSAAFAGHRLFGIIGGVSLPSSEFGATRGRYAGFAETGYMIGIETRSSSAGSGFVNGLYYSSNGLGLRSDIKNLFASSSIVFEHGSWGNAAFMFGPYFATHSTSSPAFYGDFLFGIDLIIAPKMKARSLTNGQTVEIKWKMTPASMIGAGFGIIANDRFNIGFRYYHSFDYIVPPIIKGKIRGSGVEQDVSITQSISFMTIVVGYNF